MTHGNLKYCSSETRERVEALLSSPTLHRLARDTILAGLERDCVDAANDARFAADVLRDICDELNGESEALAAARKTAGEGS